MPRFQDIPQFTRHAGYAVDVSWGFLLKYYEEHVDSYKLDTNPDFQRGYVWTPIQKVRYVEFILRGGQTGRDIYLNSPFWNSHSTPPKNLYNEYVLVDGKQRLDAVLGFLRNELQVFGGSYRQDYTDNMRLTGPSFKWHVNDLKSRAEVLQWYLDLNTGGTVHSEDEILKVQAMLAAEKPCS
jgi:hypothetical protein